MAKSTKLKASYLEPYIDTFEANRNAFCKRCMLGNTHPCPARGSELCLRIMAESGVEFDGGLQV